MNRGGLSTEDREELTESILKLKYNHNDFQM